MATNHQNQNYVALLKINKKISKKKCIKKKKIPILVGGTGLYFNAITKGISKIPNIEPEYRKKTRDLQKKIGQKKFYDALIKLDPLVKNKIEFFDTQRSIRAFEIKKYTKKSIFKWYESTKSEFLDFKIQKVFINTHEKNC